MLYCFSRSSVKFQGHTALKIVEFDPDWAFPDCSIEEVPYCFLGLSISFQGHTGWKIDDLNPIWVRLLGRSQLSNPSDLPCLYIRFFPICNINAMYVTSFMRKVKSFFMRNINVVVLPITWIWYMVGIGPRYSLRSLHIRITWFSLQWCHNERDGVSNYQPHDCLLNCLFRRR